jgi:hypothetical protein
MASIPNHPIVNEAVIRFVDNIKNERYGINPLDIGGPQLIGRVVNQFFGQDELDDIPKGEKKSVVIMGQWRTLSGTQVIFVSDDEKTPLFNRTCDSYVKSKLLQVLKGKEYQSLWMLGKVYQ